MLKAYTHASLERNSIFKIQGVGLQMFDEPIFFTAPIFAVIMIDDIIF